ncbi:hypothetical protein VTI74DRAFT_1081 [Chaetomium olivicolor]
MVTLKISQRQRQKGVRDAGGAQERQVVDTTWKTSTPTEADLQMEDWEMTDGRITAGDEPLAFSTLYLRQNQSVSLSSSITFTAIAVPSGRAHSFPADPSQTRVCMLTSGKLRVTVEGEAEFSIGAMGVWKISPGRGCVVRNRGYVDLVVNITALSST